MHLKTYTCTHNSRSHRQHLQGVALVTASTIVQPVVDCGSVRVCGDALVDTIRPELDRCRSELHALLPQLARARHDRFVERVGAAAAQLAARPSSPDTFERHLQFLGGFDDSRRGLDREMEDVEAHFDLCEV